MELMDLASVRHFNFCRNTGLKKNSPRAVYDYLLKNE